MNILQINSSARSTGSESTRLADAIVAKLVAANPGAQVTRRDLAAQPHPMLDEAALGALFTPPEAQTAAQKERVALDFVLVDQVKAADVVVIGAPMYNFGVSVQLKSWFDAITKAGVTFQYGANGPEGLLTGKKVYVTLARGGVHRNGASDVQVPHIKTMLGFVGMTDVTLIYSEGLQMGPEALVKAQAEADQQVAAIV